MFRRSQQSPHLANAESAVACILGDERAADTRASLAQLNLRVAALEEQVRSQFTSVAAYASIAQEQIEFTRSEACADLDRTRQALIDLVEQVHHESGADSRTQLPAGPPGPMAPPDTTSPSPVLAGRVAELEQAITQCFDRQRELAETVATALDIVSASHTDAPISILAFT